MKIGLTARFAILATLTLTNPGVGQAQTKERAKLIENAEKRRQGDGLRLLQRFGCQSAGGRLREKISLRQHGVLQLGKGRSFDPLLA